jgi:hypothetical protein
MKPTSMLRGYQRHRLLVCPEQCAGRFSGMAARRDSRRMEIFSTTTASWLRALAHATSRAALPQAPRFGSSRRWRSDRPERMAALRWRRSTAR